MAIGAYTRIRTECYISVYLQGIMPTGLLEANKIHLLNAYYAYMDMLRSIK